MASLAFDTHAFVKDLTASRMPTEQAEVLARTYATLLTDRLATKDDIALLRRDIAAMDEKFTGMITAQNGKFEAEFISVRGEIAALDKKFTGEIAALHKRITAEIAAQDERFDIKLAALEDRLNARITYSQLATIIILTAVMGAFNIWG